MLVCQLDAPFGIPSPGLVTEALCPCSRKQISKLCHVMLHRWRRGTLPFHGGGIALSSSCLEVTANDNKEATGRSFHRYETLRLFAVATWMPFPDKYGHQIRRVPAEGNSLPMRMRERCDWHYVLETGAYPPVARLTFKGSPWGRALFLGNEVKKGGSVSNPFADARMRPGWHRRSDLRQDRGWT